MKFTEHQFRTLAIIVSWTVVTLAIVVLVVTGTIEGAGEVRTGLLTAFGLLSAAGADAMRVAVREQRASMRPKRKPDEPPPLEGP